MQSRYSDDTTVIPTDASRYTLAFKPDGTVGVRADCNRAGGTYTVRGNAIAIRVSHMTRAMCPPASLDGTFLRDLDAAAIFFIKNGELFLDLKFDTGTMRFSP